MKSLLYQNVGQCQEISKLLTTTTGKLFNYNASTIINPRLHSRPLKKQQQQQKLEIISCYRVHTESKNAHGANPLIIEVP